MIELIEALERLLERGIVIEPVLESAWFPERRTGAFTIRLAPLPATETPQTTTEQRRGW